MTPLDARRRVTTILTERMTPQELFGTSIGAITCFFGAGQMLFAQIAAALIHDDRWLLLGQATFWFVIAIVMAITNYVLWARKPMPAPGAVTMAKVYEAQAALATRRTARRGGRPAPAKT